MAEASVLKLHICPGHRKAMRSVKGVQAILDYGLAGDSHAKPGSRRQVLLVQAETLQEVNLKPADIRENITTLGIPLTNLGPGDRLTVGQVVLEVTGPCTGCARLEEVKPGLQNTLSGHRGILAKVVHGGTIEVGESVNLMERCGS